ncbi:MAG: AAA family ATPase [Bacteroidota bacterium]
MESENNKKHNPYAMLEAANRLAALGFSVIPVNYDKKPNVKTWKPFQENIPPAFEITDMFTKNTFGIAIIGGKVSGNTEALDEDSKYDLTGTMHNEFVALVKEQAPGLYEKLLIQKTTSGGHHYIYRCTAVEGNLKLASRLASEEEQKINPKEKQKALFETRGEGGYFLFAPSPKYVLIQGDFKNIPAITPEEREILFSIARSFDQCQKEYVPPKQKAETNFTGLSPFEDYNLRGDTVALLQKHGWTSIYTKGAKTFLKRPGDSNATQSANFDRDKNWFTCFSTSTEFDIQKAYQPYAVYAVLECNNDFSLCSKKLYEDGYGDRRDNTKNNYDKFFKTNFPNANIDPDFNVTLHVISSIDLLKIDTEENRYLLSPLLPAVGTGVLAGAPDTGKSQFARQLCITVACGMEYFLDYKLTLKNKRALYIATEDDSHNSAFLLKQQLKGLNQTETENLAFIFADTLSHEEILLALDLHLTKYPCDIVIVDSFGDIFQGTDTNNTNQMRKNVRYFDYFAKKHKCFILFVHHINKAAYNETPHQKNIMGGGGLTQKVRFAWQLTQAENGKKYLTVVKGNYCPREYKENSWVLNFSEEDFIFTNTAERLATESINLDGGKNKDTKFSKLVNLADEIFGTETISYKTFCERYENQTGKAQASAKRDHKAMKDLEIIIQDEETKHWKLNGTPGLMENPNAPEEPLPF